MEADVIATEKMRALEMNAEYFGVSRLQLMENAGASIASEIAARFPSRKTQVVVFCGLGGNGGDGLAATRHLLSAGYRVKVVVAGKTADIKLEETRKNLAAVQSLRSPLLIVEVTDSSQIPEIQADIAVDALLGIGLKGPSRQPISQLIKTINELPAFRISVDTPTGLDADSGETFGEAVKADLTITFHRPKPGLLRAKDYVGELTVKNVGLPRTFEMFAGPGDVSLVVKPRPAESHKGDFGSLLVVGGSEIYSGAPALVALSALRTGVDLTYIAAPKQTAAAISSMTPNVITIKLEGAHLNSDNVPHVRRYLEKTTAAVIGPGLGLHEETRDAVSKLVVAADEIGTPLLLDADGLKAYASSRPTLQTSLVVTPHAGEYALLTRKKLPSILDEKVESVKKTAAKLGATVLLKGATDIVSDGKRVKLNFTGNPGMTVGGTGDVLAGIIGGFMAQRTDVFEAAAAGAFISGAAGDFVEREKGHHIMPTDLLDWIPQLAENPMSHLKVRNNAP